MKHSSRLTLALSLALPLSLASGACTHGSSKSTITTTSEVAKEDSEQLASLFKEHFEKNLQLNPSQAQAMGDYRFNARFENNLSDAYMSEAKELNSEYLQRAIALQSSDALSEQEQLSLSFFIYMRQVEVASEKIPEHLLPINQFHSRANSFVQQGSGEGIHPFKTEQDYRDFITKAAEFDQWVDSAIARMKEGMAAGIVLPKVLIERTLPQLEAQFAIKNLNESIFYSPLKKIPESISAEAKEALIADYEKSLDQLILPSFKKLYDFMSTEYLAAGKAEHGLNALPGGDAWYQYLISYHTTTNKEAEEIHALGLAEVARILSEMDTVRVDVGFEGDLKAFIKHLTTDPKFFFENKEDLVAGYEGLKERIGATLPSFFDVMPKAPYEVRPVEAFREQNAAGASYEAGTPGGSRPGVFYINTFNLKAQPRWGMETLSLHEAAPGHHFQISIQQEMENAPKFQRFSDGTAFAEGWALYVESIGKELGLFTDPYQYFGRLSDEMLRAMRLVVDTGLHAKGWTREQAIQYMIDNSALAESDIKAEVERYMAIPGQALSYKIGQFKITELRKLAEESLGEKFDIRQFHNQVLLDGSLPMSILEEKIKAWIERTK